MAEFRRMRVEDLPRVYEIERLAFCDPWPNEAFSMMNGYHSYVALREGLLIGYIICLSALDESSIANLAIDPQFQRQGFGKELLRFAMDELATQGIKRMFLDVRRGNLAAQGLYEQFGFVHVGVRKGYYSDPPEDALVMMWTKVTE